MFENMNSSVKNEKIAGLTFFFILSYALSWLYMIPSAMYSHNLLSNPPPTFLSYIAAYGPALSSITTVIIFNKKEMGGVFSRIIIWRVHLKWYLIALLLQPAFMLVALGLSYLLNFAPDFEHAMIFTIGDAVTLENMFASLLPFLLLQMISVLGEEIGWRGYALPTLLSSNGWFKSGLILGGLWAVWHVPLFITAGSVQSGMSPIWYFIDLMASSLIFVWLFLRTKGSVLIATLLHASINTFAIFLPIVPMRGASLMPFIILVTLKWGFVALIVFLQQLQKHVRYEKE